MDDTKDAPWGDHIQSSPDAIKLQIRYGTPTVDGTPVMITAIPPKGTSRVPVNICCVVDVSSSMNTRALVKTEGGSYTEYRLSVLDTVKHAIKAIIRSLQETDRMSLVAYSDTAKTILDATKMDEAGHVLAEMELDKLVSDGATNLWSGLESGIDILRRTWEQGRMQHVMLFTDGAPNKCPPRGILPMIKKLRDGGGGKLPCTISTFGLGHTLDSELLSALAAIGSGIYAFIPDIDSMGAAIVNAMANILTIMSSDVTLKLTLMNEAKFHGHVHGGHSIIEDGNSVSLDLGSIQFGQSKDIIVNMGVKSDAICLGAELLYSTYASGMKHAHGSIVTNRNDQSQIEVQLLRCRFVDTMRGTMKMIRIAGVGKLDGKSMSLLDAQAIVARFADAIKESPALYGSVVLRALLEDSEGQLPEALSREDWYIKWGVHYTLALMRAHLTQVCVNFKDPGIQFYGGELFHELQDRIDETFCRLPTQEPATQLQAQPTMSSYDRFAG